MSDNKYVKYIDDNIEDVANYELKRSAQGKTN